MTPITYNSGYINHYDNMNIYKPASKKTGNVEKGGPNDN